jgi:hypothetical protein
MNVENCSAKPTAKPTLKIPITPLNRWEAMHTQEQYLKRFGHKRLRCNPMLTQGWLLAILLRALEAKADLRVSAFVH